MSFSLQRVLKHVLIFGFIINIQHMIQDLVAIIQKRSLSRLSCDFWSLLIEILRDSKIESLNEEAKTFTWLPRFSDLALVAPELLRLDAIYEYVLRIIL